MESHLTEVVYAAVLGIGCVGLYYAGVVGLVMLAEAVRSIRLRGRESARERKTKAA